MTFTYVGDLSTNLDKVRFYVGDVTASAGPLPSDANFTDEEITGLISVEGSWQRAVAACFERLAASYATSVDEAFSGDYSIKGSQKADEYRALANQWRQAHGRSAAPTQPSVRRVDGYSEDIAADEV